MLACVAVNRVLDVHGRVISLAHIGDNRLSFSLELLGRHIDLEPLALQFRY